MYFILISLKFRTTEIVEATEEIYVSLIDRENKIKS